MKIALVHDDFCQSGGAESLFATIASIWQDAPIYTSLLDWRKLPASINRSRIRSSFMQKIPFAPKFFKVLLPLYPLAFESFNFDDFDLVISSTTRFAKSALTKPQTVHVSYVNSIPRFLYNKEATADYLPSKTLRFLTDFFFNWLKRWDKASSARVDYYIANSRNVALQIKTAYKKGAEIIHPFADGNFYRPAKIHKWQLKSQNYFLVVTRLVKWKKVDIAIESCANVGKNLIIVGDGPDKGRLQKLSTHYPLPTTRFLGRVTPEELRDLFQNCQALVVTQEEDFGIATVEAQACGRPVIAYQRGGQAEIIIDRQTGILFKNQTSESLQDAIIALSSLKWKVSKIRANSLRFSRKHFRAKLKEKIKKYAPDKS